MKIKKRNWYEEYEAKNDEIRKEKYMIELEELREKLEQIKESENLSYIKEIIDRIISIYVVFDKESIEYDESKKKDIEKLRYEYLEKEHKQESKDYGFEEKEEEER